MKTALILSLLLGCSTVFADGGVVGKYSNGNKDCDIEVSIGDYLHTGRDMLVVSTAQNKITEWGANFNIETAIVDQYGICPKVLTIDDGMGPGFGGNKAVILKFDDLKCQISSFALVLGNIKKPTDRLVCTGMKKVK